ncbi:hypothetical protein MTO96_048497 [Rhipicephalus appendiculatus]
MCRVVAVPCDGEEEDDLVRGVAREGGAVREDRARDRARGRAKPHCWVPTGVLGIRPGSTRQADYVCRKQFPCAELLVQRPRLHAPTAPTKIRHRTLDAFDPATSSATPNSTIMFDFRA